jgi:hypothetical protein
MTFECDCTQELVTLAQRALQGDAVPKDMPCRSAIRVIDNPPRIRYSLRSRIM